MKKIYKVQNPIGETWKEAKLIPLTHINNHFPGLVQALARGRVELVLWAQSFPLSEMMQSFPLSEMMKSYKYFPHVSKLPTSHITGHTE